MGGVGVVVLINGSFAARRRRKRAFLVRFLPKSLYLMEFVGKCEHFVKKCRTISEFVISILFHENAYNIMGHTTY
jgi:hypothetical protein